MNWALVKRLFNSKVGNRIAVDLPGIQDATRAKEILGGTATLEFHLMDQEHDAQEALKTGAIPVTSKLYKMDGMPILLKRQIVLSGDSISSAFSIFDQQTAAQQYKFNWVVVERHFLPKRPVKMLVSAWLLFLLKPKSTNK